MTVIHQIIRDNRDTTMTPDASTLEEIERATGRLPTDFTPMAGATSSDLFLLRYPEEQQVLRLFKEERWDDTGHDLSAREGRILSTISTTSLATPDLIATLPDNGVIMSWLPGAVELPAQPSQEWIMQLARPLADIHSVNVKVPYTFTSWNDTLHTSQPSWWQSDSLWAEAQSLTSSAPEYRQTFIHRDYHPVNVLWQGDRISGVVDWINACMGPAGIDVAHCRLNLAIMYGQEAAEEFLEAYRIAVPDYIHDPYWDLDDALGALPDVKPYPPWAEFGLTGLTTALVRERLQEFVQAALSMYQAGS